MDDRIAEDARFALLAKGRQARAFAPEPDFRAGSGLFEEACQWSLAGIAARFPDAREKERRDRLLKLLTLAERPGR